VFDDERLQAINARMGVDLMAWFMCNSILNSCMSICEKSHLQSLRPASKIGPILTLGVDPIIFWISSAGIFSAFAISFCFFMISGSYRQIGSGGEYPRLFAKPFTPYFLPPLRKITDCPSGQATRPSFTVNGHLSPKSDDFKK